MIAIDLSGKVALVTGGGRGLGLATATRLHQAGASVVLSYFEEGEGENRRIAEAAAASLG
ncbi:MAG TPA: SDR family NAD(P)-dependent oxidoreductase, partial [Bacteroidia bacterium]|nr:SDR family NAD(P)-dependent oxidoreductase [Bacteroidia bacterium]